MHALRACYVADEVPYLNQARRVYLYGISEMDTALVLIHRRMKI